MISPNPRQFFPGPEEELPQFAFGLLTAVDEAWNNLSSLAQCSSHKEMCAIAGARIAKELHKKGATTGADAFESFKSLYDRFTPSPNTLIDIPLPSALSMNRNLASSVQKTENNFNAKFEIILKKVQWSPSNQTGASNLSASHTLSSGRSSSSPGATTVASKRPASDVTGIGRSSVAAKRIKQ
jgi:hypothetical protein